MSFPAVQVGRRGRGRTLEGAGVQACAGSRHAIVVARRGGGWAEAQQPWCQVASADAMCDAMRHANPHATQQPLCPRLSADASHRLNLLLPAGLALRLLGLARRLPCKQARNRKAGPGTLAAQPVPLSAAAQQLPHLEKCFRPQHASDSSDLKASSLACRLRPTNPPFLAAGFSSPLACSRASVLTHLPYPSPFL